MGKKEKLETITKENDLEKQLFLKGRVENVEWYLNRAKLFVLTSRYEGLPLCLIEAMQMNVPCVSFDVKTGPSDIIENNVNGILISSFEIEKMIKEINALLKINVDFKVCLRIQEIILNVLKWKILLKNGKIYLKD